MFAIVQFSVTCASHSAVLLLDGTIPVFSVLYIMLNTVHKIPTQVNNASVPSNSHLFNWPEDASILCPPFRASTFLRLIDSTIMAKFLALPNELLHPIVGHLRHRRIDCFDPVATKYLQSVRLVSRRITHVPDCLMGLPAAVSTIVFWRQDLQRMKQFKTLRLGLHHWGGRGTSVEKGNFEFSIYCSTLKTPTTIVSFPIRRA